MTVKTSTFCEKSNEERHAENLDALGTAGCTRCFQHTDLQRKMLQSTPLRADAFDEIDLGDLHGWFRHNWVSRSASRHQPFPTYLALELRQPTVFLIEHIFTRNQA